MSETDPAHDREITGQPDHAVAHMLGGRDPLNLWCEVHPLVLVVQVGTLRDDEAIQDRMIERRQFMNIDVVGFPAPADRRGRPQHMLKVEFAQIERDNRRAVFNGRADESVKWLYSSGHTETRDIAQRMRCVR